MTAVPATRTWVAGEVVTDTHFNTNIRDVLNFLLARPIFKGYQTVSQNVATATFTAVTLDSEMVDSAGGHSTVSNTSRYTGVYAGWYDKGGGAAFAANATGRRLARTTVNGAVVNGSASGTPAGASIIPFAYRADRVFLNVGDILEDLVFQDSGGTLATFVTNAEYYSSMTLTWTSN